MREQFIDCRFRGAALAQIEQANTIIAEYMATGDKMTLRQLYYQFVAKGWLENKQRNYKNLGATINRARLAGLIDWDAIEDRTRDLDTPPRWVNPAHMLNSAASWYAVDRWDNQDTRVFVFVEKDALENVVRRPCHEWDVPYLSCRGYLCQSTMYDIAKEFEQYIDRGQRVVVLHLGDHDPSGIDMTRDNVDRLDMLSRNAGVELLRIALNYDQVEEMRPPPNPAKMTDSRAGGYVRKFGRQSWELDAVSPTALREMIAEHIKGYIDWDLWEESRLKQEEGRDELKRLQDHWPTVSRWLAKK